MSTHLFSWFRCYNTRFAIRLVSAVLLAGLTGNALAAPDLAITLKGTTNAVVGGQVGYIAEITNVAAAGTGNDASNASVTLTLPGSLQNVFWDCLALGTASCGSNTNATGTGTTITLAGLSIPAGSVATVRIPIQGTATLASTLSGSAQTSVAGETLTSNNSAALSTTVNSFPGLCTTSTNQVERRSPTNGGTASATDTWPLDSTNTVTTSVSGGITATTGAGSQSLLYSTATKLSATATLQRTSSNFTYTFTLSKPVPAQQVYFNIQDVNVGDSTIIVSVAGGASAALFAPVEGSGEGPSTGTIIRRPLAYDSASGRIYRQVPTAALSSATDTSSPQTVRGSLHFFGTGSSLVSSVTITGTNVPTGEQIAFDYGAQVRCPVFTITKSVDTSVVNVTDTGGTLSYSPQQVKYTITVKNVGTSDANNVTVTDTLPGGLNYASSTGSPALATGQPTSTSPVTFTLPTLAINASQSYTVATNVALNADTNYSALTNTAAVTSGDYGVKSVTSNAVNTDIIYPKLVKTVQNITRGGAVGSLAQGLPGDILEYCIAAKNYGSLSLSNFILSDNVPLHTTAQTGGYGTGLGVQQTAGTVTGTLTSASDTDAGSLTASGGLGNGVMTLNLGSLAANSQQTGCFRAKIN